MVWNILLLLLFSIALPVHGGAQAPTFKDESVRVIVGFPPLVQMLRASFDKLETDKQFMSDLGNVGGEDAEMISAAKIQPLVKQLLVISPGVRDFIKKIATKHFQR